MVSFLPLDLTYEESITYVFSCIDNIVQYGEDEEPVEPKDFDQDTLEAQTIGTYTYQNCYDIFMLLTAVWAHPARSAILV